MDTAAKDPWAEEGIPAEDNVTELPGMPPPVLREHDGRGIRELQVKFSGEWVDDQAEPESRELEAKLVIGKRAKITVTIEGRDYIMDAAIVDEAFKPHKDRADQLVRTLKIKAF